MPTGHDFVDDELRHALRSSAPRPSPTEEALLNAAAEALNRAHEALSDLRQARGVAAREELHRPRLPVVRWDGDDD